MKRKEEICETSDGEGGAGQETERNTKAEVLRQGGLERDSAIMQKATFMTFMVEESCQKYGPHIKIGKNGKRKKYIALSSSLISLFMSLVFLQVAV